MGSLGVVLGRLGAVLGGLGVVLGRFLGLSWLLLGRLGAPWVRQGCAGTAPGASSGAHAGYLGPPGRPLGRTWGVPEGDKLQPCAQGPGTLARLYVY